MNRKLAVEWILATLLAAMLAMPAMAQDDEQQDGDSQQQQQSGQQQSDMEERRGPYIYPNLAADLIEMGVPVIDVRSDEEVEETGLLADAEHIVHTNIDAIAEFLGDDKNRAVVIYCGSGRRAAMVIEQLRERGFSGVVNAGGYDDLKEAMEGEPDESE